MIEGMRGDSGVVYALCEPETMEIRYVGQTSIALGDRLRAHLFQATHDEMRTNYNYRWIRKVLARGLEPVLQVLEIVPVVELDRAEIGWITTLRELGCRLTNTCAGGDVGHRGLKRSVETRQKMSVSAKQRASDPVERARLASITNGKPPIRRGEASNKAKLTADKVVWLRRQAKAGCEIAQLGRELGVTPQAAWYAATGRTWKHVEELPV